MYELSRLGEGEHGFLAQTQESSDPNHDWDSKKSLSPALYPFLTEFSFPKEQSSRTKEETVGHRRTIRPEFLKQCREYKFQSSV